MRKTKLNPYASEYLPRPFSAPPFQQNYLLYTKDHNNLVKVSSSCESSTLIYHEFLSDQDKSKNPRTSHRIRSRLKYKNDFLDKLEKRIELRSEILEKRCWSPDDLNEIKKKFESVSQQGIKNSEMIKYIKDYKTLSQQIESDLFSP